jgi:hypothetical protein
MKPAKHQFTLLKQICELIPAYYRIDFFVIVKGKQRLVGSVQMNYKLVAPQANFRISNAN